MNIKNLLILLVFISANTLFAQGTSFESPQIRVVPIQDSNTGKNYELYIELPESYSENENTSYPVLFYADAIWHLEMLSGATDYILEDIILVGISWQKDISEELKQTYGAHASRFTDYSFWKKANPNHPLLKFGEAENHLDFIRNDVITYVEDSYRTVPDKHSYFGYSLSGLFGAYIITTQPDTFKNYVLGSPSIQLLIEGDDKVEFRNKERNINVFISRGTLEEEKLNEPISKFVNLLKAKANDELSIESPVIDGNHGTAFPMTAVRSVQWLSGLLKEEKL